MKIAYLTAGAGGMYCGSCLRDNTLAAALRAQGREVILIPLYTPIRTDEPDASERRVLYGAINVYLQQRWALFRSTPWWLDGFLDRPGLLRRVVRAGGSAPRVDLGELTLSVLRGEHGAQAKEVRKVVRWLSRIRPDLVNLPNAMFVHLARPIKRALGAPVLCTLTGEDVFLDTLPEPSRGAVLDLIREHGRDVDGFIAVSEYYASRCRDRFAIAGDRMHVVRPGVRIDGPPPGPPPPTSPFAVGYMARVCPDKGLHVLCEAASILRRAGRPVRVIVAGHLGDSDRPYLQDIRRRLAAEGLDPAFEYLGEVDRPGKQAMLRSLHVLSVPTVYPEPKGLFVLEALAQGVPVVQPCHGAFPELIEATGGGVLVEPVNPQALADALARLMDDPGLRAALGSRGRAAVLESFTDQVMARKTWSVYQRYRGQLRR